MGIYERDYTHARGPGNTILARITGSAVWTIIVANLLIWFAQAFTFDKSTGDAGLITGWMSASASQVFGSFQIWRPLTANFVHSPLGLGHVFFNMLALFFFGRELEQRYGRREFWILYLAAGTIAILAELVVLQVNGGVGRVVPVLGASGSVMAVVILFALHNPKRIVYLNLLIPVPIWLLCILWIISDLAGAFGGSNGVANFAHLTGAFVGFMYWRFDLRWHRVRWLVRRAMPEKRPGRRASEKVIAFPRQPSSRRETREETPEVAAISERIDRLLEKISREGKDSLSEEELEFLKENSGSYRSSH